MTDRMTDPHLLARFVVAQSQAYRQALGELRDGRKKTHWMWFIFPQIAGLGTSPTARHFALSGRAEAQAYLAHPVLGQRLLECTKALTGLQADRSAHDILSSPDDLKFRSCMTLFAEIAEDPTPFRAALARYFAGEPDRRTLDLLTPAPMRE